MNFEKAVISIFILLSYSVGIAHNFIPHCEDNHPQEIELGHENNPHFAHNHFDKNDNSSIEHEGHDHLSHKDHFDESITDLLECVLLEIEHPLDNCVSQAHIGQRALLAESDLSVDLVVTILLNVLIDTVNFEKDTFKTDSYIEPVYCRNFSITSPLRGPPTIIS